MDIQTELEEELFSRVTQLYDVDVQLVFYDTTSVYLETDDEDVEIPGVGAPQAGPLEGWPR